MDKLPLEIGRVSSMFLLKIGNNERIPVQAQHVLYLTFQNLPLCFFSLSLVPFAFQWRQKNVCRMFCSAGPLLQYSQARESLGAYVVKKHNHVDGKDKDGRKVKWYIRGNVCQVQSAWKLSVPWRADESPGPNRLVQMCYVLKCGSEVQWIRTWAVICLVNNEEFQSCPHDIKNINLENNIKSLLLLFKNNQKTKIKTSSRKVPEKTLNIGYFLLSGTEQNRMRNSAIQILRFLCSKVKAVKYSLNIFSSEKSLSFLWQRANCHCRFSSSLLWFHIYYSHWFLKELCLDLSASFSFQKRWWVSRLKIAIWFLQLVFLWQSGVNYHRSITEFNLNLQNWP